MAAETSRTASRCILSAALLISSLARKPGKPRDQQLVRRRALDLPHGSRQLQQTLALAVVEILEIDAPRGVCRAAVSWSTASSSRSMALSTRLSITVPFSSIALGTAPASCMAPRRAVDACAPTSGLTPLAAAVRSRARSHRPGRLGMLAAAYDRVCSPAAAAGPRDLPCRSCRVARDGRTGGQPPGNAHLAAPGKLVAHLLRQHRSPELAGAALAEHVGGILGQHRLQEALQHEGFELAVSIEPAARLRAGARRADSAYAADWRVGWRGMQLVRSAALQPLRPSRAGAPAAPRPPDTARGRQRAQRRARCL